MANVRLLQSEVLHATPRVTLARERFATPDGEVERLIVHHPGAVAILAQPDPQHLLLVRQYRYSVRRWTLEIPAGTREPGEAPEATAARELAEETGWRAARLTELLRFHPSIGILDEELVLYRGEGLTPAAAARDHGELVAAEPVPLAELAARREAGEICDAKTLLALALLGVPLPGMAPAAGPEAPR